MLLAEHIIDQAIKRGASDIHLLYGLKPIFRVSRALVELEDVEPLEESDLYDIYELSQKFYQNNINTELGKKAKEYLYTRNLNEDVIKEFGIGLSLNDKDIL